VGPVGERYAFKSTSLEEGATHMRCCVGGKKTARSLLVLALALLAVPSAAASPPANDAYPGEIIGSLPYTATGSTVEATGEVSEPTAGDPAAGLAVLRPGCVDSVTPDPGCLRSVWFSLPPGAEDFVTAETCGSSFDTTLADYNTEAYAPFLSFLTNATPVLFGYDRSTCAGNARSSTVTLQAWQWDAWQRLVINGVNGAAGDFVLHVYEGPDTILESVGGPHIGGIPYGPAITLQSTFVGDPTTYECSLDGSAFVPCAQLAGEEPFTPLHSTGIDFRVPTALGPHTLAARARDSVGNADPYPATLTWTTIESPPPPPPPPPATAAPRPVYVPPPRVGRPVSPGPTARLTIAAQRLRAALGRGLVATVRANMAGTVAARATISGRLAVKLHLARRPRTVVVARANTRLTRPGVVRVVLRFTNAAKTRLAQAPRAPLTVRVDVRSGSHTATATKHITLKR
jgi:hypothetical protein